MKELFLQKNVSIVLLGVAYANTALFFHSIANTKKFRPDSYKLIFVYHQRYFEIFPLSRDWCRELTEYVQNISHTTGERE